MASRRRVVWSGSARDALDEAVAYIASQSIQNARAVLERVLRVAAELAQFPDRGRFVPEIQVDTIRELFVDNFRLIYEVTDDEVRILAFLHGARDFSKWRSERK